MILETLLQKIEALTAAVNANTQALGAKPTTAATAPAVAAPPAEKPRTRAAKAVEAMQAPTAAAAAAAPTASIAHKDLVPLVTELMNADYAKCANIIEVAAGNVKGAKFPQVPAEKLPAVKEEIEAALAKLKAAPAAPPSLI